VFLFTLMLTVASGVLAGLYPSVRVSRANLAATLNESGRAGLMGRRRQWFRDALVVSQVAVSLVLLVTAGLFFQSARNATRQDMGFEIEDRIVFALDADLQRYDEARSREFFRQLIEQTRALPGVVSASTGRFLPIGFRNGSGEVFVEGAAPDKNQARPQASYNMVSEGYFRTMGMPILSGRAFNKNDTADAPAVAIINQAMAEKFWPNQNPLGRRFSDEAADGPFLEVVGVTRTVMFMLPAESPRPGYYVLFEQDFRADQVLHVHTQGDPLRMIPVIQALIRSLDPDMPVWDVRTLEAHVLRGKMKLFDLGTWIVAAFGLIAIVLAAIGLYGVMSFVVGQRTQEIGIRMALGATGGQVLWMVLARAMTKAVVGVAVGFLIAFGVTRMLANYLVDVTPTDAVTFFAVTGFLGVVALTASFVPARRATKVDPLVALRYE
jgi:predicted permease